MKNICVFDTSIASTNIGDQIIMEAFYNQMSNVLEDAYILKMGTHTPVCHFYQDFRKNPMVKWMLNCDYKFIGGSNIVLKNMFIPLTQWNINIFNCKSYKNSITVGCGLNNNSKRINLYTKLLYKKIFSKEFIHSVRDEETAKVLTSLGYKALNTGCPTTWNITKDLCKKIPTKKSNRVIFTLTDYDIDRNYDQKLIDILVDNYKEVIFFPQGGNDLSYFKTLKNIKNIKIINPNLNSYKGILKEKNIDYVGTRLHAGILAINYGIRTIVLIVDNRARDMKKDNNLNSIERKDIDKLEQLINCEIITDMNINERNIKLFKEQFNKCL